MVPAVVPAVMTRFPVIALVVVPPGHVTVCVPVRAQVPTKTAGPLALDPLPELPPPLLEHPTVITATVASTESRLITRLPIVDSLCSLRGRPRVPRDAHKAASARARRAHVVPIELSPESRGALSR